MTGLFETMLAVRGRILQLEEHIARMARSCRELQWGTLDENAFRDAARAAVGDEETAVRVTRTAAGRIEATAFVIPDATLSRRAHGRAISLAPSVVRSLPEHKLLPWTVCAEALRQAVASGADEALFVTPEGNVLEGTSTNVFAVRDDVLITAPVDAGLLPGIVREWVLSAARNLGLRIDERPPRVDELRDGGFFTGSLTLLAPIRMLDGQACDEPGAAFEALVRENARAWPTW